MDNRATLGTMMKECKEVFSQYEDGLFTDQEFYDKVFSAVAVAGQVTGLWKGSEEAEG